MEIKTLEKSGEKTLRKSQRNSRANLTRLSLSPQKTSTTDCKFKTIQAQSLQDLTGNANRGNSICGIFG